MSNSEASTDNHPPKSHRRRWLDWFAAVLICGVAVSGVVACTIIYWPQFAHQQANSMIESARRQSDLDTREMYLIVANELDSGSDTAKNELASLYYREHRYDRVIEITDDIDLNDSGLRARALSLIWTDRAADALAEAEELAAGSPDDQLIAAVIYGSQGRGESVAKIAASISAPEAAQRILAISSSDLALAREMQLLGLPEPSRALLVKQSDSFLRNVILADIELSSGDPKDAKSAQAQYEAALRINPASIETRKRLVATLRLLGLDKEAAAQQIIVDKLASGRP